MYVGERFKRDGKTYEVTSVINETNYGFKEVADEPVFDPGPSFEEEVKQEETKTRRGRKKA